MSAALDITLTSMPTLDLSQLRDRIEFVRQETGLSYRQWSKKAGIRETHVSTIRSKPGMIPRSDTLRKLADAAGISLRWLATGEGDWRAQPEPVGRDSKYPNRPRALEACRLLGFSDAAIQQVESQERAADLSPIAWMRLVEVAESEIKSAGAEDTTKKRPRSA